MRVFAHHLSSLWIAAAGTFLMRLESWTMQGDWLRARCTRLLRSHQRGPAFRTFRIPASGGAHASAAQWGRPCDSVAVGAGNGSGHSRVVSAVGIK